ncbi:BCD family MFS transporter [Methylocapsa palsarum]|uniref:MFS transporter, BCD family, chlorophyll transporter n=1 Tax=Methylocapsa palsarum TaxID=1612308 RepID=A0A1I4BBF8_9HYPH|nr:MFS transporter, BCD family, chlorophyll transporter [Methylocapsa palsarum]
MTTSPLGLSGIMRLGLVQASLGSMVVLTTSTMNRVMVVELALPATLPGALVALHYALQALRPRWGYGSDIGGRRTPWIIGGNLILALGTIGAALSIALMKVSALGGLALAVISFSLIGVGVGACGTSLLVLLAKQVEPQRRAAAATIVWIMMIAGFVATTMLAGHLLDPFSPARLVAVTSSVALISAAITIVAMWKIEDPDVEIIPAIGPSRPSFWTALGEVCAEPQARLFTVFVFLSMLAYSAEELILDPFSGAVFGYTPGESTRLSGVLHGGVLAGMILVAIAASGFGGRSIGSLRGWAAGGCLASALMLGSLTLAGFTGPGWPLRPTVFALGLANGAFSIAAISLMMSFAGAEAKPREGVRMGLWGAAQGIAFGAGGPLGRAGQRPRPPSPGVAGRGLCGGVLRRGVALYRGGVRRSAADRIGAPDEKARCRRSRSNVPAPAKGALSAADGVMR